MKRPIYFDDGFLDAYDWHVLVLHDGTEKDILGIWGPYLSESAADIALEELKKWPLDGTWTIMDVKRFRSTSTINVDGLRNFQVGDGNSQTNRF